MQFRTKLLIGAVLCTAAACSTVSVDPAPGMESATLNFLPDPNLGEAKPQNLYARSIGGCEVDLNHTKLASHNMLWGNTKGPRPIAVGKPLLLEASTTTSIGVMYRVTTFYCTSFGVLTPKAGVEYEIIHRSYNEGRCELQVVDAATRSQPDEYQPLRCEGQR